jgi:hypothetical protein
MIILHGGHGHRNSDGNIIVWFNYRYLSIPNLFDMPDEVITSAYEQVVKSINIDTTYDIDCQNHNHMRYWVGVPSSNWYPQIRITCVDEETTKYYIKARTFCYVVVAVYKWKIVLKNKSVWDHTNDISHDCHNKSCVDINCLNIIPRYVNGDKTNQRCIGIVECKQCKIQFKLCQHDTPCLTIAYRLCSKCDSANYKPVVKSDHHRKKQKKQAKRDKK